LVLELIPGTICITPEFSFLMQTLPTTKKVKAQGKASQQGDHHKCLMHMLRHSGKEPHAPQSSIRIIQHQ
jgi:hypothetical protein